MARNNGSNGSNPQLGSPASYSPGSRTRPDVVTIGAGQRLWPKPQARAMAKELTPMAQSPAREHLDRTEGQARTAYASSIPSVPLDKNEEHRLATLFAKGHKSKSLSSQAGLPQAEVGLAPPLARLVTVNNSGSVPAASRLSRRTVAGPYVPTSLADYATAAVRRSGEEEKKKK